MRIDVKQRRRAYRVIIDNLRENSVLSTQRHLPNKCRWLPIRKSSSRAINEAFLNIGVGESDAGGNGEIIKVCQAMTRA